MAAAAKQAEKLAAQEEKISELNMKIDGQNKLLAAQGQSGQNKLLAAQGQRLAELSGTTKRLDMLVADLNTRQVDINDSDMSLIQETIKKQVKLNVRKGDMPKVICPRPELSVFGESFGIVREAQNTGRNPTPNGRILISN
ncbi:MAG: hypothetical protein ACYTDW_17410 [Planctomycetota bacterium]